MLAVGIAKAETEHEKARINVKDKIDRIRRADVNTSGLSGEAPELHMGEWDAEIEHLEALTDLLLLNLEDRCYSLLNGLRGKEKQVRDALREVKVAGDCPSTAAKKSKTAQASASGSREQVAYLSRAVEELTIALHGADQQLSEIYDDLGDQYLHRPSSSSTSGSLRLLEAAQR